MHSITPSRQIIFNKIRLEYANNFVHYFSGHTRSPIHLCSCHRMPGQVVLFWRVQHTIDEMMCIYSQSPVTRP